jgi:hypothetical protein
MVGAMEWTEEEWRPAPNQAGLKNLNSRAAIEPRRKSTRQPHPGDAHDSDDANSKMTDDK